MNRLLVRAARRFYLQHPWQLGLALAGIGLGVAVFVGVQLANDSARRAFDLSAEIVGGQTTHRLLPVEGALAQRHFVELVTAGRATRAAPVLEQPVRAGGPRGRALTLLGVDPIKEIGFRDYAAFAFGGASTTPNLIVEPGSVLVPAALAADLGLEAGGALELWAASGMHRVRIAGIMDEAAAASGGAAPLVADIATAQAIAGRYEALSRVDLRLTPEQARRLGEDPPPGTTLVEAGARADALNDMTRAFATNLTALGLLALVVGMFLIYSTISFAIVQRRESMGILRSIGLDRRDLLGSVLIEAALIGIVGTAAGLALGHALAQGLVGMVLQTLGSFYFSSEVRAVQPSPWIYAQGAALGLGATLAAALGPALDASRIAPDAAMRRATLERATHVRSRVAALAAVPAAALGLLLLAVGPSGLVVAFGALFCVLCAGALLTPWATAMLMKGLEPLAGRGFGLPALLAVRGVGASLSRTGVAAAALAVAVATVIGIGLMIGSFRVSLENWLDTTLTADIYVTLDGRAAREAGEPAVLRAIQALPQVAGIGLTRFTRVPTDRGEIAIQALEPGPEGWGLDIVRPAADEALAAVARGDLVVSEPLSYRLGLDVGDALELPTAGGAHRFRVAGVYRDYNTGAGGVAMSLDSYRSHWSDDRVSGIGVHLEPGASGEPAMRALESLFENLGGAGIRSTEAIERLSLAVFDRTFRITEVLRLLAGSIAFLGVLSAVLAIELERARETATLRALGFAPSQLAKLTILQTGLLGAAAGLVAVPLGAALAALLVHVINRRSFGWTMDFVPAPEPVALGLALAIGAALLAGLYPAFQNLRGPAQAALRDE